MYQAADVSQFLPLLVLITASLLQSWLKKRRKQEQEQARSRPAAHPAQHPEQPAQTRRAPENAVELNSFMARLADWGIESSDEDDEEPDGEEKPAGASAAPEKPLSTEESPVQLPPVSTRRSPAAL
jgi:hypothetical protein